MLYAGGSLLAAMCQRLSQLMPAADVPLQRLRCPYARHAFDKAAVNWISNIDEHERYRGGLLAQRR